MPPPLPVLGEVPAFRLTSQDGRPYGSEELRGKVWVANFIFTSCTSSCPRLTSKMAIVQRRIRNTDESVHLVSFSVDPDNDTPARLAAYAEQYHYDHRNVGDDLRERCFGGDHVRVPVHHHHNVLDWDAEFFAAGLLHLA